LSEVGKGQLKKILVELFFEGAVEIRIVLEFVEHGHDAVGFIAVEKSVGVPSGLGRDQTAAVAVKGRTGPEVEQAYTRALELCKRLGDPPELFPALFGLWLLYFLRAELPKAHELAQQLLPRAQSSNDPRYCCSPTSPSDIRSKG
jgi:hypothetical protein